MMVVLKLTLFIAMVVVLKLTLFIAMVNGFKSWLLWFFLV